MNKTNLVKFYLSFLKIDLKFIIFLGLLIREIFSPFTGHPWDFELFVRLGPFIASGKGPYDAIPYVPSLSFWYEGQEIMLSIAYPPIYAYFSAIVYIFYSSLNVNFPYLYYFILKQPILIGDVLTGYLIYKIVFQRIKDHKKSLKFSFLWLFNPLSIIFSAIWGLPHSLAIMFILFSILNYKSFKGFIYIIISFLIIGLPFIFLFPYIARKIFEEKRKGTDLINLTLIFLNLGIILPLIPMMFLKWRLEALFAAFYDVLFKVKFGQFNAWFFISYSSFYLKDVFNVIFPISLYFLPYAWFPLTILSPFIFYKFSKINDSFHKYLDSFLITLLIFFIFRQSINEQYVLYLIAIGLILIGLYHKEISAYLFLIATNTIIFLITNNSFLIRLFSPLDPNFYKFEINILTFNEFFSFLRFTIMVISGFLNTILLILLLDKFLKNENLHISTKILSFIRRSGKMHIRNFKKIIFKT